MSELEADLEREVKRLRKINKSLMDRVERGMEMQGDAFSLFQAATVLEKKVKERTADLENVLHQLKRSNRHLRVAKDAAESAARLKDEFLASMSHELRTPLNAVLGLAEALQEQVYGPVSPRQVECLQTIESSGRHLLSLINEILDVARLGAGEMKADVSRVNIRKLCATSLRLVEPQSSGKRITVKAEMTDAVERIATDGKRLKQILVNLLSNAVKFTPDGGEIGLKVEPDEDETQLRFTVWDTGIGISEDDLERVFQPFVQIDSGLARKYEGTGLGLSLVLQMSAFLGGSVRADSKLGEGSAFTVTLPIVWAGEHAIRVRAASSNPSRQSVLPSPSAKLILLAEDNPANQMMIGDYLRARGYRVELAENGTEAVSKARTLQPDVILMDVQMPEMDGIEAMKAIREGGMKQVPIVALTALAMKGDKERCLSAGANDYVSKPVSLKKLAKAVENLG